MSEMILIDRAVLAALVDPKGKEYADGEDGTCNFCGCDFMDRTVIHKPSCPVQLAQEALAAQEAPS